MIFLRHPLSVKLLFIICIIIYLFFFFSGFLLFALKRCIGSKSGVKPREKGRVFPLTSSILSYDIRLITFIILVLIIILYPHQYLLIKMKWMYLTIFSQHMNWNFFLFPFLFHSWRGRSQSHVVWNVRVEFATKTLLPCRTDICCLSKVTCMSEK